MSWYVGLWMLGIYAAAVFVLSAVYAGKVTSKVGYLEAWRSVPEWKGAFSIASSWIWAPALFVSAQKAYVEGWVGLFWFTVPNVLTLVLFGLFGAKLREKLPLGYTVSSYMGSRFGNGAHNLYLVQNFGLLVACLAVQMLGGGKVVAQVTGLPYPVVTVLLAGIAISYSMVFGLKASIITDWFKMLLVFALLAAVVPWAVARGGGLSFTGAGGEFTSLISGKGAGVFWSFGLATTIGLLSGPFGDQSFYQRAFAVSEGKVRGAFMKSAAIFAVVPLAMSMLGFAARGSGTVVTNPGMVNLAYIQSVLPSWAVVAFAFLVMSALLSTMDSHFTAISSVVGHDLLGRFAPRAAGDRRTVDETTPEEDARTLRWSRVGMVVTALAGIAIANIPGMQILWLFLFYGTLRASTLLPTVFAVLMKRKFSRWGVNVGIGASFLVGLPIFVYGNVNKVTHLIVIGSLTTVLVSGLVMLLWPNGQE